MTMPGNSNPNIATTMTISKNIQTLQASKVSKFNHMIALVGLFSMAVLITGCASTTRTLDPDVEQNYDASYSFSAVI